MQLLHLDKVAYKVLMKERSAVDKLVLFVGTITPLATIPQIITIYSSRSAANISVYTWSLYALSSVLFLCYAIVHRLLPLILSSILWVLVDIIVVAGYLIFN